MEKLMEPPRNGPSYAELRERIRELEAALRPFVDDCIRAEHIEAARKVLEGEHSPSDSGAESK
jgi:hypothetical protein